MSDAQALNETECAIVSRRTSKVLLPVELRHEQQAAWTDDHSNTLQRMLQAAAWAPFHKRAHEQYQSEALDAVMPWRFHVAGPEACTALLAFLKQQADTFPDSKWSRAWQSKISNMISGCGVLVQATWLPEPLEIDEQLAVTDEPVFSQKNIEHVAAASSAIQNLLVAAQSHQWLSYWSSGGILREEAVFDYLNIDRREKLLGSVFLSPEPHASARIIDGGLRDQRGNLSGWVHRI